MPDTFAWEPVPVERKATRKMEGVKLPARGRLYYFESPLPYCPFLVFTHPRA